MSWAIDTPFTHSFEEAGNCGSAKDSKTLWRSYPSHTRAHVIIQRLCTCFVCVCVFNSRLSLELSDGVPILWGDSQVNQDLQGESETWSLGGSLANFFNRPTWCGAVKTLCAEDVENPSLCAEERLERARICLICYERHILPLVW
jgi:hypothetical protein